MQARRLNVSQRALTDLLEDYEYTSQFNPIAARRLLDDLNAKMASLAELDLTGSSENSFLDCGPSPFAAGASIS